MSGLALPNQRINPTELDPEDRVFRHESRPGWGLGVWVREESTRRRLRFEDGKMRAFKKGYYGMLKPVDTEAVDVDEVFERVMGEHEEASQLSGGQVEDPVMPFAKQIDVFLHLYPEGFRSDAWAAEWGDQAKDARNLQGASATLKELLAADADPSTVGPALLTHLHGLTLLGAASKRAIAAMNDDDKVAFGKAAHDLVHGEARFSRRYGQWRDALVAITNDPKWRLATVVLALASPNKHILVRRQVMRLQARSVSPAKIPTQPSLAGYRRARRVGRGTRDKLLQAGLKPRDLLDVYGFIWETLRPKGQRIAAEI